MAEIEFELFNNQLVQQLVGPQDGNLKIIEKALGAEIAAFGNRIRISGDEEAVRQAKNAVDALYSKVSRGIAVGEQEVLAAVRISGAEANGRSTSTTSCSRPKNATFIPVRPRRRNISSK